MSTLLLLLTLLRPVYVVVDVGPATLEDGFGEEVMVDVMTPQSRVCDVAVDVYLLSLPIESVRHSTSLLLDFLTTQRRLVSVVLSHDSFYDRVLAGFG